MEKIATAAAVIFGAIITLAIVGVIVGNKSPAPQAIAATGQFLSRVVAAAVSPAATAETNGNPELGTFTLPSITGAASLANGLGGGALSFPNFGGFN